MDVLHLERKTKWGKSMQAYLLSVKTIALIAEKSTQTNSVCVSLILLSTLMALSFGWNMVSFLLLRGA